MLKNYFKTALKAPAGSNEKKKENARLKVFAGGKLHSEIVLEETGAEAIQISYGHGMWAHTIHYTNTR